MSRGAMTTDWVDGIVASSGQEFASRNVCYALYLYQPLARLTYSPCRSPHACFDSEMCLVFAVHSYVIGLRITRRLHFLIKHQQTNHLVITTYNYCSALTFFDLHSINSSRSQLNRRHNYWYYQITITRTRSDCSYEQVALSLLNVNS